MQSHERCRRVQHGLSESTTYGARGARGLLNPRAVGQKIPTKIGRRLSQCPTSAPTPQEQNTPARSATTSVGGLSVMKGRYGACTACVFMPCPTVGAALGRHSLKDGSTRRSAIRSRSSLGDGVTHASADQKCCAQTRVATTASQIRPTMVMASARGRSLHRRGQQPGFGQRVLQLLPEPRQAFAARR